MKISSYPALETKIFLITLLSLIFKLMPSSFTSTSSEELPITRPANDMMDKKLPTAPLTYKHILIPTMIYFALVFALYPLQIQIIIQAICDNKGSDDDTDESDDGDCDSAAISSRAAIINTYCSIALYLPTILLTGPYGALVNRHGRKLGLCVPIIGAILGTLCFLFIHSAQPSYFALVAVLGCLLMGVTGGYSTFIVSVFSYTSDMTRESPLERKKSFPIVEGFIFLPKLFSPVGTGLWVKAFGFTYPLVAAVALGFIALLWIICMVPESLPHDAAVRKVPLDLNPMQTFRNIAFIYQHQVKLGKSPLLLISVAFCLYYISYISFASVLILYCKHVFNWGPDTIGFFDGLDGGLHACSMFFAPFLVHQICQREFTLLNWIQLGYITRGLFFLGIGLSPSTVYVFAMVALLAVAGPATPYTRTILANTVLPSEQAQIFAAFSAVESISTLLSPLMTVLYSVSAQHDMPALVFFVMAILLVSSNLIVTYVRLTPAFRHNLPDEVLSDSGGVYSGSFSSFSSFSGLQQGCLGQQQYCDDGDSHVSVSSDYYSSGEGRRQENNEKERLLST